MGASYIGCQKQSNICYPGLFDKAATTALQEGANNESC
jgi:hypothetical protein